MSPGIRSPGRKSDLRELSTYIEQNTNQNVCALTPKYVATNTENHKNYRHPINRNINDIHTETCSKPLSHSHHGVHGVPTQGESSFGHIDLME